MKRYGKKKKSGAWERKEPLLGELLHRDPKLLEVLRRHEVSFCAGCYLTLFSTPERAAAYHGVRERARFLRELSAKRPV